MSDKFISAANPKAQYEAYKKEIDHAIEKVLSRGWYILGEEVGLFEKEFAAFTGCSFCIGCASGTDALILALKSVGIQPGDEVITVSHSAVATAAAIERNGDRQAGRFHFLFVKRWVMKLRVSVKCGAFVDENRMVCAEAREENVRDCYTWTPYSTARMNCIRKADDMFDYCINVAESM